MGGPVEPGRDAGEMDTGMVATVSGVSVDPATARVPLGGSLQLRAVVEYTAGQRPSPEPPIGWSSSDNAVATVDSTGKVSALRAGQATITAIVAGKAGMAVITVEERRLTALKLSPDPASVRVGGTQALVLTSTYDDGQSSDVTANAEWSSSDATVVTVSNDPPKGVLTGRKIGKATVRAKIAMLEAQLEIDVKAAGPTALLLLPGRLTMAPGSSRQFRALASYPDGTTRDVTAEAAWTSSAAATLTVGSTGTDVGRVLARVAGTAMVMASFDGRQASAEVQVLAPVSLRVTPSTVTLPVSGKQRAEARATFADGSSQDVTADATWRSAAPGVATVGNEGATRLITAVAAGSTEIIAALGTLEDGATVTVTAATLTTLTIVPPSARLAPGTRIAVQAHAFHSDGSRREVTSEVTWTSSAPTRGMVSAGAGTDGRTFLTVAPTAEGGEVITLTATLGGQTATATITVSEAELSTLVVHPARALTAPGASVDFRAIGLFSDGSNQDLTDTVAWQSSAAAIARVEGSDASERGGRVAGLAAGTSTISARLGAVSASAPLTVSSSALTGLSVEPVTVRLAAGTTSRLSAVASFADGRFQDVTESAAWTSSADGVAWVGNAPGDRGQLAAVTAGTTTVRASFGGMSGSVPVQVSDARLRTVSLSTTNIRAARGTTVALKATGVYSDGSSQDVTGVVRWESLAPAIAQVVSGGPDAGTILALGAGNAVVVARAGTLLASGSVTVSGATTSSVRIEVAGAAPARLARGTTLGLRAMASFSDGTSQDVTTSTFWTSMDPAIAEVATGGRERGQVTGVAAGTTMVRANWQGTTGMLAVQVTDATLSSIEVAPLMASLPKGLSQQFQATGRFSDMSTQPLDQAIWSVSGPEARVSNLPGTRGLATAVSAGNATVTASFAGRTGTAMMSITAPIQVRLVVTPPGPVTIARNTSFALRAFAEFSDGTSREVTDDATWTSAASGVVTVSDTIPTRGRALGVAEGSASVTARFEGKASSTLVNVTGATITSMSINPMSLRLAAGATSFVVATGVFSDMSTQDLTLSVNWSSTNLAVATVGNTPTTEGQVKGVAPGTASVQASFGGVQATAAVEVP